MFLKDLTVYTERRRTYHMLNAVTEVSETGTGIRKKQKLIKETQEEAEVLYFIASDKTQMKGGNIYE